jgi:hypothetical protein
LLLTTAQQQPVFRQASPDSPDVLQRSPAKAHERPQRSARAGDQGPLLQTVPGRPAKVMYAYTGLAQAPDPSRTLCVADDGLLYQPGVDAVYRIDPRSGVSLLARLDADRRQQASRRLDAGPGRPLVRHDDGRRRLWIWRGLQHPHPATGAVTVLVSFGGPLRASTTSPASATTNCRRPAMRPVRFHQRRRAPWLWHRLAGNA